MYFVSLDNIYAKTALYSSEIFTPAKKSVFVRKLFKYFLLGCDTYTYYLIFYSYNFI